jgi:exopolysaccharide production protein ExoY
MAHVSDVRQDVSADYFEKAQKPARKLQNKRIFQRHFKRAFDILAIILSAPITVPLILILALLVRRDGGAAFYTQARIGLERHNFRLWKLRTMVPDAEDLLEAHLEANPEARREWDETQKLRDDPRITPLGRILRKTSADELPQLWNIFLGDMSLVGPRPFLPEQASLYPGQAYYSLRPGLTGFWQVYGRNETTFADRAAYDSRYARRVSFLTDIRVLFATIRVVLRGTGY